MLRKILILLIKFIPVIQMAGILLNNLLYFNDIYFLSYIIDYIIGNSIVTTFLLIVCSYIFHFCTWHRLIITANIINITIAAIDAIYKFPITDIQLLLLYHFVAVIFIIIATIIHINKKMINIKLRVLRGLLEECINNIGAGNSNHNEEELDEIIKYLTKVNRGIKRISKREACERILHCSPRFFYINNLDLILTFETNILYLSKIIAIIN